MTIIEIENLTFDELKAQRGQLAAELKDLPADELAARYIQARTDAKQRDEKLAEQGQTIKTLNASVARMMHDSGAAEAAATALTRLHKANSLEVSKQHSSLRAATKELGCQLAESQAEVATQTARAERLKTEALRNHSAITSAAKLLNDAISSQNVATANGE